MSPSPRDREPLSPGTLRFLHRLTTVLGLAAGVLLIATFIAGVVREGTERWLLLVLGLVFLATPLVLRQLLPPR